MERQPLSAYYLKQYVLSKHQPIPKPTPTLSRTRSNERDHEKVDKVDGPTNMPATSDMPTPATNKRLELSLSSSMPMESNPLYQSVMFRSNQSSLVSVNSSKEMQREHELCHENSQSGGSRMVGIDSLLQRLVSTVPEEDEEDYEVILNDVSSGLIKVQSELVSSEGIPMSLDFLKPIEAAHKRGVPNLQDKWVMVHDNHSPLPHGRNSNPVSPTVSNAIPSKSAITPDVTPVQSHGTEWSSATSNNE